ncbi:arylsulfatase [Bacteroides sp.]|uniref:arylsulfatase n=1 Tax=Bacteroides sp. TaxID=29523 RepID=UPI003A8FD390
MRPRFFYSMSVVSTFCFVSLQAQDRPNVLLIMADDMGYSDIGCYGGEIPTPNLDRLSEQGVRFTQFYNTSRSCPARASLMTGLYQHQAGIGQMSEDPVNEKNPNPYKNDWGTDGYKGFLNRNCVTIAEVLKESGYHTYMVGKWHLGMHDEEKWPLQRGFDRFYGILAGACSYLRPQGGRGLSLGNEKLPPPDAPYYTTDAFTDYALKFLQEQQDGNPFFMYVAYNAPHWPLQAHEEDIRKFVEYYRENGWDKVRKARRRRMVEMGMVRDEWDFAEWESRRWDELSDSEKDESAYRMAVYAAQVHCMDRNIGRMLDYLEKKGELKNTLVFFLSDNGACAEPYKELGGGTLEDINDPSKSGNVSYGVAWAQVSNTPYRRYKVQSYEGGISTPLIMSWPAGIGISSGALRTVKGYLPDIMPTIVEATGAAYPETFHGGKTIYPMVGESLLGVAEGKQKNEVHEYMYWEHQMNAAVRKGDWKAVREGEDGKWQLYDLAVDRTERNNLALKHTDILKDLVSHWDKWAADYKVYPKRKKK